MTTVFLLLAYITTAQIHVMHEYSNAAACMLAKDAIVVEKNITLICVRIRKGNEYGDG